MKVKDHFYYFPRILETVNNLKRSVMATLQNKKLIKNQTPLPKSINICYNKKYIKNIQAAELGN